MSLDIVIVPHEPLKGRTRRKGAKRERLRQAEDAAHATRSGIGCIGALRRKPQERTP